MDQLQLISYWLFYLCQILLILKLPHEISSKIWNHVYRYITDQQKHIWNHCNGLVQDCSKSNALAMEILQSCTKLSIYRWRHIEKLISIFVVSLVSADVQAPSDAGVMTNDEQVWATYVFRSGTWIIVSILYNIFLVPGVALKFFIKDWNQLSVFCWKSFFNDAVYIVPFTTSFSITVTSHECISVSNHPESTSDQWIPSQKASKEKIIFLSVWSSLLKHWKLFYGPHTCLSDCVCIMHEIKTENHHKGTFTHARADAGGKLASTQIITCVHTCAVAERRRSGSKNRSARNGSNTQFTAPASKPRAPNHHCPQEMADPPASAPRMCEHTRDNAGGISKSARLRSATAPRMCERSFIMPTLLSLALLENVITITPSGDQVVIMTTVRFQCMITRDAGVIMGWGLLSQFPLFCYFPNFSELSKYWLPMEYHVHIWQMSLQLSCGDICQIWMWFGESNMYFCSIENFANREINEQSFSNPHPCPVARIPFMLVGLCQVICIYVQNNSWTVPDDSQANIVGSFTGKNDHMCKLISQLNSLLGVNCWLFCQPSVLGWGKTQHTSRPTWVATRSSWGPVWEPRTVDSYSPVAGGLACWPMA